MNKHDKNVKARVMLIYTDVKSNGLSRTAHLYEEGFTFDRTTMTMNVYITFLVLRLMKSTYNCFIINVLTGL